MDSRLKHRTRRTFDPFFFIRNLAILIRDFELNKLPVRDLRFCFSHELIQFYNGYVGKQNISKSGKHTHRYRNDPPTTRSGKRTRTKQKKSMDKSHPSNLKHQSFDSEPSIDAQTSCSAGAVWDLPDAQRELKQIESIKYTDVPTDLNQSALQGNISIGPGVTLSCVNVNPPIANNPGTAQEEQTSQSVDQTHCDNASMKRKIDVNITNAILNTVQGLSATNIHTSPKGDNAYREALSETKNSLVNQNGGELEIKGSNVNVIKLNSGSTLNNTRQTDGSSVNDDRCNTTQSEIGDISSEVDENIRENSKPENRDSMFQETTNVSGKENDPVNSEEELKISSEEEDRKPMHFADKEQPNRKDEDMDSDMCLDPQAKEIQTLKNIINERDHDVKELKTKLESVDAREHEIQELTKKIQDKENTEQMLKANVERCEAKMHDLEKQVTEGRKECEDCLKEQEERIGTQEQEIQELTRTIQDKNNAEKSLKAELERCEAKMHDSEKQVTEGRKEYEDRLKEQEERIGTQEQEIQELTRTIQDKNNAEKSLKAELERCEAKMHDSEKQVTEGRKEYEDRLKEQEERIGTQEQEIQELTRTIQDKDNIEKSLKAELERCDAKIHDLEKKIIEGNLEDERCLKEQNERQEEREQNDSTINTDVPNNLNQSAQQGNINIGAGVTFSYVNVNPSNVNNPSTAQEEQTSQSLEQTHCNNAAIKRNIDVNITNAVLNTVQGLSATSNHNSPRGGDEYREALSETKNSIMNQNDGDLEIKGSNVNVIKVNSGSFQNNTREACGSNVNDDHFNAAKAGMEDKSSRVDERIGETNKTETKDTMIIETIHEGGNESNPLNTEEDLATTIKEDRQTSFEKAEDKVKPSSNYSGNGNIKDVHKMQERLDIQVREIEILMNTIEEKDQAVKELKTKLDKLHTQQQEMQELKKIMQEKENTEETLKTKIQRCEAKIHDLEKQRIEDSMENESRLKEEEERLKQNVQELEKIIQEEKDTEQILKAEIHRCEAKIHDLQKDSTDSDHRLKEQEESSNKQKHEIQTLKNTIQDKENTEEKLIAELERLHTQQQEMQELEKIIQEKENTEETLKTEIQRCEAKIHDLEKQRIEDSMESQSRLKEEEERLDKQKHEIHALKQTIEDKENIEQILKADKERLKQTVQELQKTIQEEKDTEQILKAEIQRCEAKIHNLQEESTESEHRLKEQEESSNKQKHEIQTLKKTIQDKENTEQKLIAELERLHTQQQEMHELEKKIQDKENTEETLKTEIQRYQAKIHDLEEHRVEDSMENESRLKEQEERLDTREQEIKTLMKTIQEMQHKEKTLEAALERLDMQKQKMHELEETIEEKENAEEKLKAKIGRMQEQITELKKESEKENTIRYREYQKSLGQVIGGSTLMENNPAVTDLSDPNRPLDLGDKFSELYDNEWTEAMEEINDGTQEEESITLLLKIVIEAYDLCKETSENLRERIMGSVKTCFKVEDVPHEVKKICNYHRKSVAVYAVEPLQKTFVIKHKKYESLPKMISYMKKCVEVCWFMTVRDPMVVIDQSVPITLDLDIYKPYTKQGPHMDYLVWPPLYLHKTDGKFGPMLGKGVAQGKK